MCNFTNQVSPFLVFNYALRSLLTVCQIQRLTRLMFFFFFLRKRENDYGNRRILPLERKHCGHKMIIKSAINHDICVCASTEDFVLLEECLIKDMSSP